MKLKAIKCQSFLFTTKDGFKLKQNGPDICVEVLYKLFPELNPIENNSILNVSITKRKYKNAIFVEYKQGAKVVINSEEYTITIYTQDFLNKHNLFEFYLRITKSASDSERSATTI